MFPRWTGRFLVQKGVHIASFCCLSEERLSCFWGKVVKGVVKATVAATATMEEVATQLELITIRSALRVGVSGIFGTTVMQRNIKWRT